MRLEDLFIDVKEFPDDGYGLFQLIFITTVYGYILFTGSNMISDGSELLLLIPSMAGLIGSTVLPVLGAVPDGLIVLFSGLGPGAQQQLDVGIGALAGSTVLLLTVPWFLCIVAGRVNINEDTNTLQYRMPKLVPENNLSWFGTGVSLSKSVNFSANVMMVTSVSYLFIEFSALAYRNSDSLTIVTEENSYAIATFILSFTFFIAYIVYQYTYTQSSTDTVNEMDETLREGLKTGKMTLVAVVEGVLNLKKHVTSGKGSGNGTSSSSTAATDRDRLINGDKTTIERLKKILKPFYMKYADHFNNTLSVDDLTVVLRDLGEPLNASQTKKYFNEFDADNNGVLDLDEFVRFAIKFTHSHSAIMTDVAFEKMSPRPTTARQSSMEAANHHQVEMLKLQLHQQKDIQQQHGVAAAAEENSYNGEEEEEEEEEEEIPEDLVSLSYAEQQRRILLRSFYTMGLGTLLVIIFSDPMVGCLDELGKRLNISGFYVAFVLAPLASNASEIIASFKYAQKKTQSSMSISLSALLGAGIMNNTFVLAVFMLVLITQKLYFKYFAETVSILVAEFAVAIYALKSKHTVFDGFVILSFYPLTLLLVYSLYFFGLG